MSGIIFKTPLTDPELTVFTQYFNQLDFQNKGTVSQDQINPFILRSGLTPKVLSGLWVLVDQPNRSQLNFKQFAALLRAIGHLQQFPLSTISSALFDIPSPNVTFNSIAPVNSMRDVPNSRTSTEGNTSQAPPVDLPLLTPNDLAKFSQLFDRSKGQADILSGIDAKQIFVKAKLPNKLLGAIWYLCDRDASGSLTKEEFIVAMHLIDLRLSKHASMEVIPRKLPQEMWESVNLSSIVAPPPPPPPPIQNGPRAVSSVEAPKSPQSIPQPPPHRTGTILTSIFVPYKGSADDWTVPSQQIQDFDKIFDDLNKEGAETLGPDVLVPFLLKSSLSREDLANVWELADTERQSALSKDEFAISMLLVQKLKAGTALPTELPYELLDCVGLGDEESAVSEGEESDVSSVESAPNSFVPTPSNVGTGQPKEITSPTAGNAEIEMAQNSINDLNEQIDTTEKKLMSVNNVDMTKEEQLEGLKAQESELAEKLSLLRKNLEDITANTTRLENTIQETNQSNTTLHQQLTVAEGNYHASEAKLDELDNSLQESSVANEQLKEDIVRLESMTASINSELATKQEQVRDALTSADPNSKLLESNKITLANLQNEITGLNENIAIYIKKKDELDNYENIVKKQHEKLERRYKELEKHNEKIKQFEKALKVKGLDKKKTVREVIPLTASSEEPPKSTSGKPVDLVSNNTDDLAAKIDHIELDPMVIHQKTVEEQVVQKTESISKHVDDDDDDDNDEIFEDTIDQILPSTEIDESVESSSSDQNNSDYVKVPTNLSVEPFENIESSEANENETEKNE